MTLPETYEVAQYTDEQGFDSFWVAEGRMARDGIVPAAIVASQTKQIRIGTGVVNNKSRNVALMGVTFKTLDEVAPIRANVRVGFATSPRTSTATTRSLLAWVTLVRNGRNGLEHGAPFVHGHAWSWHDSTAATQSSHVGMPVASRGSDP